MANDGMKVMSDLTEHQSRQVLKSFKTQSTTRWKTNNANTAAYSAGRLLDCLLWGQAEVLSGSSEPCDFLRAV